jgi:cell division protein FtsW (lipid II flippase)
VKEEVYHSTDQIQGRLLSLAALFCGVYALALTLSPAVRERSWLGLGEYRWDHWLGVFVWLVFFRLVHVQSSRWLPDRDPFLLPLAGLLSGWGMLTVWRLLPGFGLRQTAWLGVAMSVVIAGLRLDPELHFLRRFKYLWLTGSLALTALTLLVGTNPLGYGPRMWLGCCGIYLQPSEPLKLMLIAYLAAYLADRYPFSILTAAFKSKSRLDLEGSTSPALAVAPLLPLLAPTFIMAGLALTLLIVQRDLGTASILFFLSAVIVYLASGRKSVLLAALLGILLAGGAGYFLFDVVRVRVDGWLDPWLDPSGRSFQIVQSLIAIANGGLFGRGPGLGNPGLVPLAHSDLIFAAIAEEQGLMGVFILLLVYAFLSMRGLRAALHAPDAYRRYLAAGLIAYFTWQAVLIIGGSLRLLPLTGVTLPFVSYGGSSLVTSFVALLLLLHVSARRERLPAPQSTYPAYAQLGAFLLAGLTAAALAAGWWSVARGPDLLTRTDNPRRAISDRTVRRGSILDRGKNPINISTGNPGDYVRTVLFPDLSNVVGYTNPTYGQSGVEASQDGYLRGIQGNSGLRIWWEHILYGQPPPGLDVRLSLDLHLQQAASALLHGQRGALVLLNAATGEILVMASEPGFDANQLDLEWDRLIADPGAPLLNRAVLGQYPLGDWQAGPFAALIASIENLPEPSIRLPARVGPTSLKEAGGLSPLQVALLAAVLTDQGVQPAPLFVVAVDIPQTGWVLLPALETARQVLSADQAREMVAAAGVENTNIWQGVWEVPIPNKAGVTWYIAGTLPGWDGIPLAVALLLEQEDLALAQSIGQAMLESTMQP